MFNLIIFITFALMALTIFIVGILFIYQKKQNAYLEAIEKLKLDHEKNTLKVQLEIQEQIFQHVAGEIHDNISLSLTLAKLYLNTLDWNDLARAKYQVDASLIQISGAIIDLSDLSKGMNSEIIAKQGLLEVLQREIERLKGLNIFKLKYKIIGEPVFMDSQKELIIFRIIQEAFNNIIKHAHASLVNLTLDYDRDRIRVSIFDNGQGFSKTNVEKENESRAGLNNMQKRAALCNGRTLIESIPGSGTSILITIPYE